jgi:hypothetical protein
MKRKGLPPFYSTGGEFGSFPWTHHKIIIGNVYEDSISPAVLIKDALSL